MREGDGKGAKKTKVVMNGGRLGDNGAWFGGELFLGHNAHWEGVFIILVLLLLMKTDALHFY